LADRHEQRRLLPSAAAASRFRGLLKAKLGEDLPRPPGCSPRPGPEDAGTGGGGELLRYKNHSLTFALSVKPSVASSCTAQQPDCIPRQSDETGKLRGSLTVLNIWNFWFF